MFLFQVLFLIELWSGCENEKFEYALGKQRGRYQDKYGFCRDENHDFRVQRNCSNEWKNDHRWYEMQFLVYWFIFTCKNPYENYDDK